MHVYTFVLTSDEVKNLVTEYVILLDLHPCVLPSSLTMNRLLADKIGKEGQGKIFNEFCTSLKHLKDHFFLIDRRANLDAMPWRHQDSSVADPAPTSVHAEDIRQLCDPLPVCLNFSSSLWLEVFELIPEKFDHQKVVEYENERKLEAKRKAQAAKDRAVMKRAATKGASQRMKKKKKTTPLSFALSDSEEDGFSNYHSASPLNTIIANEAELTIGGGSLILESVNRVEEDTEHQIIMLTLDSSNDNKGVSSEAPSITIAKKPIPKVIFKSPILIKGYVLGLANVETWDDIVKKFQMRTPERCANKLKGKRKNHLVEIQVDDHALLVNFDNENDDMLGYESEKYSEDEDADGTNHAEDADETNHSDLKLVKRGITRLYKFHREYGKPSRIKIKVTIDALNRVSGLHTSLLLRVFRRYGS
nr:hypothetical protein [Tanacetum cinerariifolium]